MLCSCQLCFQCKKGVQRPIFDGCSKVKHALRAFLRPLMSFKQSIYRHIGDPLFLLYSGRCNEESGFALLAVMSANK